MSKKANADSILIRNSTPEDLDEVFSLLQQLWPNRQLNKELFGKAFLNSFDIEGHIIRLACSGNEVIGLCALSLRNNLYAQGTLANIDELVIDEKYRGKGIGKLMLDDVTSIARDKNCPFLELESAFHREDAHRFYEKEGFEKTGYFLSKKLKQQ
ncbi:Ribosomal protein S18 acetylase RimI [Daejeonella rubra]|uniref:Ribosomal protein S18 acetylase RimI n=2 Tax=Daejeonella rubra TaxID=990371 RepID=A0A1G9M851_9SPHI|nr:Ribosomal protein S18 acetylase RimI [Daejeonella rubra]